VLSNDDYRASAAANARRLILDHYTWSKIAEKIDHGLPNRFLT
jgi:hypothetical protein